jgi:hypothetical protein
VLVLYRGSEGVLSISGELIPLLEAPKERRRKVVGVASGLMLGVMAGVS